MGVTPSQFDLLGQLLDAASLRHHVIAQNVANVNTPGYQRLDVTFESALEHEMRSGGEVRLSEPRVVAAPGGVPREDGNNVDVDLEIGRLNTNTLLYNVYAQLLATKIAAMRSAINGR